MTLQEVINAMRQKHITHPARNMETESCALVKFPLVHEFINEYTHSG